MANFLKLCICQYIIGKNTRGKCRGKCPKFWYHIISRLLKYEPYVWCNAEVFLKLLTTSVKSLHFYRGKHTQHKFTTLTIFRSQSHFHAPITTTLPRTSSTSQTETPARETITPHPSSCRPHCFTTTIRFSVSGFDPSMYFKNGTTQFSHLVSDFLHLWFFHVVISQDFFPSQSWRYVNVPMYHSVYPFTHWQTFWLLWMMLLWICVQTPVRSLPPGPLGTPPEAGWLDHMVTLGLSFWGASVLFPTAATLFFIPTNSDKDSSSLLPWQLILSACLVGSILPGVYTFLTVALMGISLIVMLGIFSGVLAICTSSLDKHQLKSFAHF